MLYFCRRIGKGQLIIFPLDTHQRYRELQASVQRIEEQIEEIDKQIKEIEKKIESIINKDTELKKRMNYILSIKGVGLLTAVCILAETNGIATVGNIKQLTGYAGLDVKLKESGKRKGKSKISKRGNRFIRKALYFTTFSKIKRDAPTNEKYRRLKEDKGIPMVAAVAQQRKRLGLIYTLWKKQEMFLPTITDRQTSGNTEVQAFPLALTLTEEQEKKCGNQSSHITG
jgi:transposase